MYNEHIVMMYLFSLLKVLKVKRNSLDLFLRNRNTKEVRLRN